MNDNLIKLLLENSGFTNVRVESDYIYFTDPSCIFPAFDTILNWAWIVVCVLTLVMLFGWGLLYIKNGVKIDTLFNNAKSLLLIFAVLSVVKPIVNVIYGDKLFEKQCEIVNVSRNDVDALLKQRENRYENSNNEILYENFDVIDSGVVYDIFDEPND